MKALDTNILVRFLMKDDEKMAGACFLLQRAHDERRQFFVATVVVLELIWVLKSVYRLSREDILDGIERLLMMPVLSFESAGLIRELVQTGRSTRLELSDALIGLCGNAHDCERTVTFDKDAGRSELFEMAPL